MIKIGIHGVPRSGTTWLGQLINSSPNVKYKYQPLFSYELKGFLNENATNEEINDFFIKLQNTESNFLDQIDGIQKGIIPTFQKDTISHIVYKEVRYHHIIQNMLEQDSELKIIGIIRSPLASISSWLRSPKEFRKDLGWDEMEEWRNANKKNEQKPEEFYGFEKWKEAALLFESLQQTYPDRFYLISYNDLLSDTENEIKKLFSFSELAMNNQTIDFIKQSRSQNIVDTYSVFNSKTQDNDWKNQLNPVLINAIQNDLRNTTLEKYL
jgi:hypothetical protein